MLTRGGLLALAKNPIQVLRLIRPLAGRSHAILVRATDGAFYVLKCTSTSREPNVLFNEAAGNELYQAFGLSVPSWKGLFVSDEIIDENPDCWTAGSGRSMRPESGLCIGSRYLGNPEEPCPNGNLPTLSFDRVRNRSSFWLAWLIDIC